MALRDAEYASTDPTTEHSCEFDASSVVYTHQRHSVAMPWPPILFTCTQDDSITTRGKLLESTLAPGPHPDLPQ